MQYVEVECRSDFEEAADILTAVLADIGFESFSEEKGTLKAYIPEEAYDERLLNETLEPYRASFPFSIQVKVIPQQNWNATWEESFQPVVIDGKLRIRAAFHEPDPTYPMELLIQPKMSFGTGHHATTSLVAEAMLENGMAGKKVFDFGTGTGILAILASKSGASGVWAVDNDPQCIENAQENFDLNHCSSIQLALGDIRAFQHEKYDVVLANITRNIIVQFLQQISAAIVKGGTLIASGFFVSDLEGLTHEAKQYGLELQVQKEKDKWCCAIFKKES